MLNRTLILTLFVTMVFWSCAAIDQIAKSQAVIEKCKFDLISIDADYTIEKPRIRGLTIKKGAILIDFDLEVEITNTTETDLSLNKIDFKLLIEGKHIATGTTSQFTEIPTGGNAILPAKLRVNAINATEKFVKQLKENKLPYEVFATFTFIFFKKNVPITIPFRGVLNG